MIVTVKDLVKTFEQRGTFPWSPVRYVHAVQGVDIQVAPGEIVALVGQSGSGKTTVSRMILGTRRAKQWRNLVGWNPMGWS